MNLDEAATADRWPARSYFGTDAEAGWNRGLHFTANLCARYRLREKWANLGMESMTLLSQHEYGLQCPAEEAVLVLHLSPAACGRTTGSPGAWGPVGARKGCNPWSWPDGGRLQIHVPSGLDNCNPHRKETSCVIKAHSCSRFGQNNNNHKTHTTHTHTHTYVCACT